MVDKQKTDSEENYVEKTQHGGKKAGWGRLKDGIRVIDSWRHGGRVSIYRLSRVIAISLLPSAPPVQPSTAFNTPVFAVKACNGASENKDLNGEGEVEHQDR